MFTTLTSFLPSVLQINAEQRSIPSTPDTVVAGSSAEKSEPERRPPLSVSVEGVASKKKEKKDKLANETFIVVRPPPSKSNHPLNLQVQLVPPQSRHERPSATFHHFASTSTTSSGRRTIIPLYNLQAHNVMANTIVDAGTDAKIAKFARRGLEVIGLAIFEPVEIRSSAPLPGILPPTGSARTSCEDAQREFASSPRPQTRSPNSRPTTADSSLVRHSPTRTRELLQKPSINLTPPSPDPSSVDVPSQRGAKKLFTRMFKKKDPARPLSIAVPDAGNHASPLNSSLRTAAATARQSYDIPVSGFLQPDTPQPSDGGTSTALGPPVLGTQPALYPPITPPKGRPTKYIWVVRKWLKGTETGLLNGMMGKLSVNGRSGALAPGTPQVEVRFEWTRGRQKERGRKGREDKTLSAPGTGASGGEGRRGSAALINHSPSASIRQASSQLPNPSTRDATAGNHRHSAVSQLTTSSGTETSLDSGTAHQAAEESGDESDPEDSETPWACVITVQSLGPSPVSTSVRLKIATLAPTPHHPKVVGLLKMPFPLPDIEVEQLAVRRRVVTAQGISKTTSNCPGLVLTAEEIKDVISSTALWLVVREAFGGVGRDRRKGDGWRI
ncbi:hypothetical protein BU15DRAFT_88290 [Melanogaster broomeanus]|nr:hypothetical protein BU15DRAFT_88290 [Melanogaster broomeanus]